MRINSHLKLRQSGISLIELVIFIVIVATALTATTLLYVSTTRNSADPLMRIRSVELAQSTLEEILVKAYDENTPLGGGCVEMNDATTTACTSGVAAASDPDPTLSPLRPLTAEEGTTNRSSFDDVDDYHNKSYCGLNGAPHSSCTDTCLDMVDESGNSIKNKYIGYAICIRVSYAGGAATEINNVSPAAGISVATNDAKKIDVIVTDPLNSTISLTGYRLNY